MNRYQVYVFLGGVAVLIVGLALLVWCVSLVREWRRVSSETARVEAIADAQWEERTTHSKGCSVVTVTRMARWGHQSEVVETFEVGRVKVDSPDWKLKVSALRDEARGRAFDLNLESLG